MVTKFSSCVNFNWLQRGFLKRKERETEFSAASKAYSRTPVSSCYRYSSPKVASPAHCCVHLKKSLGDFILFPEKLFVWRVEKTWRWIILLQFGNAHLQQKNNRVGRRRVYFLQHFCLLRSIITFLSVFCLFAIFSAFYNGLAKKAIFYALWLIGIKMVAAATFCSVASSGVTWIRERAWDPLSATWGGERPLNH